MSGRFQNQVALITGAGSGIGEATALGFQREGAKVVVVDINAANAEKVAASLRANGGQAVAFTADVADPVAAKAMIDFAVSTYGRLDVLHNNATALEIGSVEHLSLEGWNKTLAVNVTAPFLATKYALPIMLKQGGGAIVNTASISGTRGDYGMSAYNAGKAAIINFSRSAAIEYASRNIRINCVCPGAIDTPAMRVLTGQGDGQPPAYVSVASSTGALPKVSAEVGAQLRQRMASAHPIGRLGRPEEIANVVLFLASAEASFVTGAAYIVDGGITAHTGLPMLA